MLLGDGLEIVGGARLNDNHQVANARLLQLRGQQLQVREHSLFMGVPIPTNACSIPSIAFAREESAISETESMYVFFLSLVLMTTATHFTRSSRSPASIPAMMSVPDVAPIAMTRSAQGLKVEKSPPASACAKRMIESRTRRVAACVIAV